MYIDLWLEKEKMTLFQLARKLKVTREYIVRILKGKKRPSHRVAMELEALSKGGVKAWEFYLDPTKFVAKDPDDIE